MVTLARFVSLLFNLWSFAILARVLLSWFNMSPYHPAIQALDMVTEPILGPLRRIIPPVGMMDISPIVALLLVQFAEQIVVSVILSLA